MLKLVSLSLVLALHATIVFSETEFQNFSAEFAAASPATIEDLSSDALWAGRCVEKGSPNSLRNGAMLVYFDDNIPGEDQLQLVFTVKKPMYDETVFEVMPAPEALAWHQDHEEEVDGFASPIQTSRGVVGGNLNNNGVRFLDIVIRKATGIAGETLVLTETTCQTWCQHYSGHRYAQGEVLEYCVHSSDRLNSQIGGD